MVLDETAIDNSLQIFASDAEILLAAVTLKG